MTVYPFVAVRVSLMDGIDPVDEIKKVLIDDDTCWFGKYGERLSTSLLESVNAKEKAHYICLVRRDSKQKLYTYEAFDLVEMARRKDPRTKNQPAYYKNIQHRISTWIRVRPYSGPRFEINDLIVRSSAQSLTRSLNRSMRGHFLCKIVRYR